MILRRHFADAQPDRRSRLAAGAHRAGQARHRRAVPRADRRDGAAAVAVARTGRAAAGAAADDGFTQFVEAAVVRRPGRGRPRAAARQPAQAGGAQAGVTPGPSGRCCRPARVDAVHDCATARPRCCRAREAVAPPGVRRAGAVLAEVQEYRLYSDVCSACGREHRAALPPGVPSGQIGPRALALIGVLGARYHLTCMLPPL